MRLTEDQEQAQLLKYVSAQYPDLPFRSDKDGQFAKGKALWSKARQKGRKGFPDLLFPLRVGPYAGLVIEFKRTGERIVKKDGSLREDQHLLDQAWWLLWFQDCGCYATFAVGFDEAKKIIDDYMNERL